jgi:hypothetical protein
VKIARWWVLVVLAFPALALAQPPSLAERLPRDTDFYILWRGTAAVQASRATNRLLRVWSDPSAAPLRERLEERLLLGGRNRSHLIGFTLEELQAFLPLLENALVAGYAPRRKAPEGKLPPSAAAPAPAEPAKPQDARFFVLDTTGKQSLLAQFLARLRAQGESTLSRFGMDTIETLELPDGTTHYFAQVGHYFLDADQKELLEELITRFSVAAHLPTLAETPGYQRAQREIGPGTALELFVHVPDLGQRPPQPGSHFNSGAFFHGLHLERAQVVCAGVTFEPATTRLHAAVLGDTSPGSVLDAVGPSESAFLTLFAAPPGASYRAARIDAAALYQDVHDALGAALAPEQLLQVAVFEAAIEQQLGMAPTDFLKLLGGEFAAIYLKAGTAGHADLYAVTINQPANVLAFLHRTLGKSVLDEKQDGVTDFLRLGGGCASVKPPKDCKWQYSLAVTPKMLVGGRDASQVAAAVARLDHPASTTLAADPKFTSARARLPKELSGLSFVNLGGVDWQQYLAPLAKGVAKEMPSRPAAPVPLPDSAVLSRYLHEAVYGWWKNSSGIHFTLYVE